jgi:15-cis-phytoene synthase
VTTTAERRGSIAFSGSDEDAILQRASTENFPVALRVLPRRTRAHLLAIYGFARLVDQAGDDAAGDRLVLLDCVEDELDSAFAGSPRDPLFRRLAPTIRELRLPREPFVRLIDANRRDQRETRYERYADLLAYCELSANPVGELVLHVFGAATPELVALSDRICTALQLVEHWQDVGEDYRSGRVYLPAEDLRRFGVTDRDLAAPQASEGLRLLLAFETERARALLDAGAPLVGRLRGTARLAVAGYVGGGRAAIGTLEACRYDVLARAPQAGRARRLLAVAKTYRGMTPPATTAAPAYEHCRRIVRSSRTSFYNGMRLLPNGRREALFAVYALARRIDDVADGALPAGEKLVRLEAVRAELAAIETSRDPILVAVRDAAARFPIPLEAFGDLVDGAEMDARGTSYETWTDLEVYCRRVAGSIGRLALGVFRTNDRARAQPLADDLGVALQVGNILRDLAEDVPEGRVYVPAGDLARFGCEVRAGRIAGPAELVVAFEAERGLGWLRRGLALVPLLDRRSAAAVLAMAASYRRLLERIARDPGACLERRPSLRRSEKGWAIVRGLAGGIR